MATETTATSPERPGGFTVTAIDVAASGDTIIAAPAAGYFLAIYSIVFSAEGATNIKFRSNATDKTGSIFLNAKGNGALDLRSEPWVTCAAAEALKIFMSANVNVGITVWSKTWPVET